MSDSDGPSVFDEILDTTAAQSQHSNSIPPRQQDPATPGSFQFSAPAEVKSDGSISNPPTLRENAAGSSNTAPQNVEANNGNPTTNVSSGNPAMTGENVYREPIEFVKIDGNDPSKPQPKPQEGTNPFYPPWDPTNPFYQSFFPAEDLSCP